MAPHSTNQAISTFPPPNNNMIGSISQHSPGVRRVTQNHTGKANQERATLGQPKFTEGKRRRSIQITSANDLKEQNKNKGNVPKKSQKKRDNL